MPAEYSKNKVFIMNWRGRNRENYNAYMNSYYTENSDKINTMRRHRRFVANEFKAFLNILL